MLIRNAEIHFSDRVDLRIAGGCVAEIAAVLAPQTGEATIDAHGNALIAGLHDHHMHFLASAAARESVFCGPPGVCSQQALVDVLHERAQRLAAGQWLRGIGYHESVAGGIDRHWLDRAVPDVPVRIQHRSGRLWILNSCALARLGDLDTAPLEQQNGEYSGRLYDADVWLRARIGRQLPDIYRASRRLARYGVTGFTDTSVSNNAEAFAQFARWQGNGELLQHAVIMGDASLTDCASTGRLQRGPLKLHLHENDLPDFDAMCSAIAASHVTNRAVAVHCVTLVELIFTLNAFAEAGVLPGDRIEHAGVTPPDALERIAELRLIVVTQPNFIAERGDAYRRDVDVADQPWLYRLRAFRDAGVALAAGTDAPFGALNPWYAMQAAVTRSTAGGFVMGAQEAVSAEQALELFLGDPLRPGAGSNRIAIGRPATLCLLDRPWQRARADLAQVRVDATWIDGVPVWRA